MGNKTLKSFGCIIPHIEAFLEYILKRKKKRVRGSNASSSVLHADFKSELVIFIIVVLFSNPHQKFKFYTVC